MSVALAAISSVAPAAADGSRAGTASGSARVVDLTTLKAGQPVMHKRGDGVKPPAELGNPSEWGVVKIEIPKAGVSVRPLGGSCQQVSHGQWCYGWEFSGSKKQCYSNYMANVQHMSSVRVVNIDYASGWVRAGLTSNARSDTIGQAYTCYSYYNNA
ncbi:hypothetical protein ACFVX6_24065 [Streptomyces sp. NPDC058289]|uniref:hypothetical protein n=1 Tax=Streptomyces sp. NPDC058289 TaxID=3346425 RepID=UPI0036E414CC